jgi:hypothetical protein
VSAFACGQFQQARHLCDTLLDEAAGVPASTTALHAIAARLAAVTGDHDGADRHLAVGDDLLPRLAPLSNPIFQHFAAHLLVEEVRGVYGEPDALDPLLPFVDSPDTRWAALATVLGAARAHARHGHVDRALSVLATAVPVLDRADARAPNYPLVVTFAADILWLVERTDHLDIIERNLRTKVIDPDWRYPEVDGRHAMALLCALDSRFDEARDWFAQARAVLAVEGTEPLIVPVDRDEAIMELRRGASGDRTRVAHCIAAARAGAAHPAMAGWHAQLDQLEHQLLD